MPDKADLLLGLFAGFVIGFLVGMYLTRTGALAAQPKQYGVKYNYDAQGRLTEVVPIPVPG